MTLNWPTLPEGYQWDYDTNRAIELLRISIWNVDKTTKIAALTLDENRALEVDDLEAEIQFMIDSVEQQLLNTIDWYESQEAARQLREAKLTSARNTIESLKTSSPEATPAPISGEE